MGVKATIDRYRDQLKEWFDLRHGDSNSRAFVAVGLVAVLVVSGLAVALGSSQSTSLLNLLDGHGWLTSNQASTLVLADGSTGKVDLSLKLDGNGNSRMLRVGNRDVLVNQTSKGTSTSYLDLGTFKVEPGVQVAQGSANVDVVAGDKELYTIDKNAGVITARDPVTMRKIGTLKLGGNLTNGQTDSAGRLWVINTTNGLLESADVVAGRLVGGNGAQIVAPHTDRLQVELTMANNHPVVLDLAKDLLVAAPDGTPGASLSVPKLPTGSNVQMPRTVESKVIPLSVSGKSNAEVLLAQLTPDGSPDSFITKQPASINASDELGTPQSYNNKVYVPDVSTGKVVVLDEQGSQTDLIPVGDPNKKLDLSLQGGDLWINQTDGNNATVVDPSGEHHTVDKLDAPISNVATPTTTTVPPTTVPPTTTQPPVSPVSPGTPTATTVPAQAPSAPTLSASGGNATATLNWSDSYDGGSPITSWTYTWTVTRGNGTGGSQTVQESADPAGVTATGLKNGNTYSFSVKATNGVGDSPASPAQIVSPSADVPSAPTGLVAKDNHDGSITVSWSPADGAGHNITGYQLAVTDVTTPANSFTPATTPAPSDSTATVSQPLTTKTNPGLILGDSYTFTVVAKNDLNNDSPKSSESSAVTSDSVPLAVSGLRATSPAAGQLVITWSCVTTAVACSGGSTVTSFNVSISGGPTVPPVTASTSTSSYSTTVPGLTPETTYSVSVAPVNANGPQVSGVSKVSTAPIGPPGAPTGVQGSGSGGTINWSWTAPSITGGQQVCYQLSGAVGGTTCATTAQSNPGCGNSQTLTVTAVGSPISLTGGALQGGGATPACTIQVTLITNQVPFVAGPNPRCLQGGACGEYQGNGYSFTAVCSTKSAYGYYELAPYPGGNSTGPLGYYWIERTDGKWTPIGYTNATSGADTYASGIPTC